MTIPTGGNLITAIISAIVDSFTNLLSGLGTGIVHTFDTLFVERAAEGGAVTGITVFAIIALVFVGVGIATKLVSYLRNKIN